MTTPTRGLRRVHQTVVFWTPKAQRQAVLDHMMANPKTREHVRELMAEQRQQYRANDRGMER